MRRLGIVLWLLAVTPLWAAEDCAALRSCVDEGWHVGIAMGVGARSNPLEDGDKIPLVLLPDLIWYGETAYFDNGELGAQFEWTETQAFDTFLAFNSERAYFSFWHPRNLFLTRTFTTSNTNQEDGIANERITLSIEAIEQRRWAVDAGIRWHVYLDNAEWQFTATTDASGVHNGQQFTWRYLQEWQLGDAILHGYLGATWKSSALIDYYYGIDADDRVVPELYYQGKAGWQPEIGVFFSLPINDNWSWMLRGSVIKLHEGMTDSPIVEDKQVSTLFAGVSYQF